MVLGSLGVGEGERLPLPPPPSIPWKGPRGSPRVRWRCGHCDLTEQGVGRGALPVSSSALELPLDEPILTHFPLSR